MDVKTYMSTDMVTISPETTVIEALDLMKEHDIHRLPVVVDGHLVGLVTEEIIARNSPSTATSLSVHELNYLLNKTTAKDIMIKQVVTVHKDTLLEEAAVLMRTKNIGVLVVVEDQNKLLGIITDKDIFDAFVDILGYYTPGSRLVIEITEDRKGTLEDISSIMKNNDINITQIAVYHQEGAIMVVLQVESQQPDEVADLLAQKNYKVVSAVKKRA
ncbi:CBS and ACT domain-containing protein [Granulicatella seriolae]|uniref:CBS and ACT domain-containing protein n=1 Tax=Granulicatella seriolae TaxID=2967226 RepID=A0ABT1WPR1_9LACT|nr:CBS and ACT domain-containing protein [Granulicatella seriolae]